LDLPNSTPNQSKKIKKQQDNYGNKMNNMKLRRTQHEKDQELLIFEEPMLMIPNDCKFMKLFSESCEKWCGSHGCKCARSSLELW